MKIADVDGNRRWGGIGVLSAGGLGEKMGAS